MRTVPPTQNNYLVAPRHDLDGKAPPSWFASIFPTTFGVAGSKFEAYSGTAFGILFAIALTGGMLLPWAVGRLAQSVRTASGSASGGC